MMTAQLASRHLHIDLSILIFVIANLFLGASAHGYVESPRSRNYRAHEEGKEYDQNGLNHKASDSNRYGSGLCGVSSSGKNYDTYLNEWKSEATYVAGGIIKITSRLTAYHGGHIEIGACADDEPTQKCFDRNKLKYRGGGHPRDKAYPERAYLGTTSDRGETYIHRFKLPRNVSGKRVLLQWRYFTANSCEPGGYEEYFEKRGWNSGRTGRCNKDTYDDTGGTAPERFWNCIEISVRKRGSWRPFRPPSDTISTTTVGGDSIQEETNPEDSAVDSSVTEDSEDSPPYCRRQSKKCGPNFECPNNACCSQWGYCGRTHAHCNECCQSNCREF